MEAMVSSKEVIEHIAGEYLATSRNAFFLGRNIDYFVAMEAALKLKKSLIFKLKVLQVAN